MSEISSTSVADRGGSIVSTIDVLERNFPSHGFSVDTTSSSDAFGIRDITGREVTKIYKLGEKGSGIRLQGEIQDFNKLRRHCLSTGKLFEDPEFPALDSSIYVNERPVEYLKEIEWKRPKEIVDNPQLFVDGPSRFDAKQGVSLKNCWMVCSFSSLAMQPKLLQQVLPLDQSFDNNYAGIFRVRFWQFGKWIEVVVDDRLPMYDGKLFCTRSANKNEFWSSIVEKAYIKLHGYWDAMAYGFNREALEDLTGGIAQLWKTDNIPSDFFEIILEAQERNSLMGCIVEIKADKTIGEYRERQGLVLGHAYSITKAVNLLKGAVDRVEKVPLLRLRNPWGYNEWKGAWSDASPEWALVPENVKRDIGFGTGDDGEFWISFEDWKKHFDIVEICYLNLNFFMTRNYGDGLKIWETNSFEGEWVIGATAGGSMDDLEKFQHNPQYRITLKDETTLIIALMQRNRRTQRKHRAKFLMIGFYLFKLPEESLNDDQLPKPLNSDFFRANEPLKIDTLTDGESMIERTLFFDYRQASCRIILKPGTYFIVPCTLMDNEEGEFLLRVFTEEPIDMIEYDDQVGDIENAILRESENLNGHEVKLKNLFRRSAGDDWEFDWREHKENLDSGLGKVLSEDGFSKEASRSMISLLDEDNSGKLGYREVQRFRNNLKAWKAAYDQWDKNGSGYLEPFQLREALKSAGFRLNNRILNLLLRRYGTEDGHVKFDDYLICAVKLNRMIEAFKDRVSPETNTATLTIEEWIETTLKS